jgi:hypothetical protein
MPSNFSSDPKVGPRGKQQEKKRVGARLLTHNILKVGGMLELWDGIRLNSQARVQDEVNLHNLEKKTIRAS